MSEREFISQFGSWMGTELGVGYLFLQNLEGIVPVSSSLQNCYGKVKNCSDSWSIVCNLYVFSSHVLNSSFLKFHVLMWAYSHILCWNLDEPIQSHGHLMFSSTGNLFFFFFPIYDYLPSFISFFTFWAFWFCFLVSSSIPSITFHFCYHNFNF